MKRTPPSIDARRTGDFRRELLTRARAWIRDWALDEPAGDFGAALVDVAARFSAQVAERLDRAGEKLPLGLLDWLAVRGSAARPARMPVAFRLADAARDSVLAPRGTRVQADVDGASVAFETEDIVNLVPGTLAQLVAVDAAKDEYFLPPPGLTSLDPADPLPNRWTLKNFADAGSTRLQLDPALGLAEGALIEMAGHQYRVLKAEGDLAEIEPGVVNTGGLARDTEALRVEAFRPFDGAAHNQQEHALYLGDKDVLNIEAAATIEVIGAQALREATWEYFGKTPEDTQPGWRAMALAENQPDDAVLLEKAAGAIDAIKIGDGEPSRWIRARMKTVAGSAPLLEDVDGLKLVINRGNDRERCPAGGGIADPGALAEGFANSTPITFASVFYPLGREPRQFDAFYLGCADAFSKKGANVAICFEMADASVDSFGVLGSGKHENSFVAGVGQDSALHIYQLDQSTGGLRKHRDLEPQQPPKPGANGVAAEGTSVALVQKPAWRPALWEDDSSGAETIYIATAAGAAVWVWKENLQRPDLCGWVSYGSIAASAPTGVNAQVSGLLYIQSTLFACFDGQLYAHSALEADAGKPWDRVPLTDLQGTNALAGTLSCIGPVRRDLPAPDTGWEVSGMVGVVSDGVRGVAHAIDPWGRSLPLDAAPASDVSAGSIPVGIDLGGTTYYFWSQATPGGAIRAVRSVPQMVGDPVRTSIGSTPLASGPDAIVGKSLDVFDDNGDATVVATGSRADSSWLLTWAPFSVAAPPSLSQNELQAGTGPLGGAPSLLGDFVIAPGSQGDAWISPWDPDASIADSATPHIGAIVDNPALLVANDLVICDPGAGNPHEGATVTSYVGSNSGSFLYALHPHSGNPAFATNLPNPLLFMFRSGTPGTELPGTEDGAGNLKLVANDPTATGNWLAVRTAAGTRFAQATRDLTGPNPDVVSLSPDPGLVGGNGDPVDYWRAVPLTARIAPYFALSPATSVGITVGQLTGTPFVFDSPLQPPSQRAESFRDDGAGHPLIIALTRNWTVAPVNNNPRNFSFDASTANWKRQFEPPAVNPELGWEYWNSTSWVRLELDADETRDLTGTGLVKFRVPAALSPTDVSGKVNHWIRARLIVGDYGRENITVVTVPRPGGGTEQTVVRDTSDFHPPLVVAMRVRYALDTATFPEAVLTRDSGSWRDQSDANRTPGAAIEGFVPLSVLMRRLAPPAPATGTPANPPAGSSPPASDCSCGTATASATPPATPAGSATAVTSPTDSRAMFLGFDAGLKGEPVNVLVLAEERLHDNFAPLTVEALNKDRFEPLTAKDSTRALGESGLLSMSFPVMPSPRDLFGSTRSWLRLCPSRLDPTGEWKPVVRGAYLNSAWTQATESLTREPLGSSDGRPGLTLNIARPPLLADTLELRVREPLDEEERQELIAADRPLDADHVIVKWGLPDLPGDWVLWRQVPDPADCGPGDRVYALDESSGEIVFGDGIHGMIPPIGRDAIVAFRYQRTEPAADGSDAVPANAVAARTALNLVTPVEGVEATIAVEHSAGGTPPESTARVLRFGTAQLRHRGRALVPRDFEDLARASSPGIAQARALRTGSGLRLVMVMAGAEPRPTAVQRRALQRLLRASAAPMFGDKSALRVDAPRIRRVRVHLALRVQTLDDAGETALDANQALKRLFDVALGGIDGEGWPLGASPSEDDIAFALDGARGLEGIDGIALSTVGPDGSDQAWQPTVRTDELVCLDVDGVRIEFETLETQA